MYAISPIKIGSVAVGVTVATWALLSAVKATLGVAAALAVCAVLGTLAYYGLSIT